MQNFVDKCLADTGVAVPSFGSIRLPFLHRTALAGVLHVPGAIVSVFFRAAAAGIAFGNFESFINRFILFIFIFISPKTPATFRAFLLAVE